MISSVTALLGRRFHGRVSKDLDACQVRSLKSNLHKEQWFIESAGFLMLIVKVPGLSRTVTSWSSRTEEHDEHSSGGVLGSSENIVVFYG